MGHKDIAFLLKKVLLGTATPDERRAAEDWYQSTNQSADNVWRMEQPDEEARVKAEMRDQIFKRMAKPAKVSRILTLRNMAAAVTLITIISAAFFYLKASKASLPTAKSGVIALGSHAHQNRFMLLPDGSTMILHPGSEAQFDFSGRNREVSLSGEAFFDVKHMTGRPFIIRTGKITTTVLGTAFLVKAYVNKPVVVTVSRGKVSVSGMNHRVLAVLTPDRQAEMPTADQVVVPKAVVSSTAIGWVKQDMQFNDMSFGQLADKLSQRYNVVINFKNEALKNCPITGRFTGTETLEQVLKVITETTATTFVEDDNKIVIDGAGCGNP